MVCDREIVRVTHTRARACTHTHTHTHGGGGGEGRGGRQADRQAETDGQTERRWLVGRGNGWSERREKKQKVER